MKDTGTAGQRLRDEWLGQAIESLLDEAMITTAVAIASEQVSNPLRRLSGAGEANDPGCLKQQMIWAALRWKALAAGQETLEYWLSQATQREGTLRDFVDFVALTGALIVKEIESEWSRLEHLLGMAALRLKLEPSKAMAEDAASRLGIVILRPGLLDHREIAAACSIRLATVRNALSRREMQLQSGGVEIGEAMDWMIKRKGFLYADINAVIPERRINGRLAAGYLAQLPNVRQRRLISRLRLSEWETLPTQQRFAINSQGVKHCLMMLTSADITPLVALGAVAAENRSRDPNARLYQESFPCAAGEQLWQFQVPNMAVLDALVAWLSRQVDVVAAPVASQSRGEGSLAALGRDCQADQE